MHRNRQSNLALTRSLTACAAIFFIGLQSQNSFAASQDLLNDPLNFSRATLYLRPFVALPSAFNDIISMTTQPGDSRLYITSQEGRIFPVDHNRDGTGGNTLEEIYLVSNTIPYDADFDEDGDVDGQDFFVWQRNFGSTDGYLSVGDANHEDVVDNTDLVIWQDQYGIQASELAAQSVPEPNCGLLLICALTA